MGFLARRTAVELGRLVLAGGLLTGIVACGDDAEPTGPRVAAKPALPAAPEKVSTTSISRHPALVPTDAYVAAVNAHRPEDLKTVFAPDATVDIVGRVFTGREEILRDFVEDDVLRSGGRYKVLGRKIEKGRLVIEYTFGNGSFTEHFTYSCTAKDGMITTLVGRYV